jgi:hypothetical protein
MGESELTITIDSSKTKRWRNKKGKLHRLDGPAVEWRNGSKEWWVDGFRHRSDGPSIVYTDGHMEWHVIGMRHREDGPAIIYNDGTMEWFIIDVHYRKKEEYFDALSDEAKSKCLFSKDFLNE